MLFPHLRWAIPALVLTLLATACASVRSPYTTKRDKTGKGAAVGAVAGAAGAVAAGKDKADQILVGAAIGALAGGSIGAYLDLQEEKLARIPGTSVERIDNRTLLVHFESDVLFDVDSATLDSSARGAVDDMAVVLNEYPKTAIVVQG
ncbi:MAG: cell envelope biogenesis protein OmpA, partial [Acidobacteria bacterium]|nr:cell envelope biogenesis protein OmpA [Acidobacteriota bacterium]